MQLDISKYQNQRLPIREARSSHLKNKSNKKTRSIKNENTENQIYCHFELQLILNLNNKQVLLPHWAIIFITPHRTNIKYSSQDLNTVLY